VFNNVPSRSKTTNSLLIYQRGIQYKIVSKV
jgi:hypothetical protein